MTDDSIRVARARVAAVLESCTRVQLQVVVVAAPDGERLAARDRARAAAIAAGRGPLLDEAVEAAREQTIRAFASSGFSGTWAATDMAVSVARASDRVAAAAALEEAAIAAVVEDLVDDDTLEVLRSTWDELVDLRAMPSPGSLASFTAPAAGAVRGPVQVGILVVAVIVLGAFGIAVGMAVGVLALALPIVILPLVVIAALTRRQPQA